MWVSQGRLPIGLTIGGYHHGTTEKAGNRHRTRCREVVALDVRRDVRQRGIQAARCQHAPRTTSPSQRVERELIDHHGHTLGLNTLHDTLNGARAEAAVARLRGRAIHADDRFLLAPVDLAPHHLQHLIGDEDFAGSAGADESFNRVLRHFLVARQLLLGIFGQAVAAVAEARAVTAGVNTRPQAHAVDDGAGIKPAKDNSNEIGINS